MKRLIDAYALGIGKANPAMFENNGYADGWNSAIEILEQAPAVDAEPVVRCRDCKYARPYDYKYVTCLCHPTFIHYSPVDGYCYLGKKTDGGEKHAVD